MRRTDCYMYCQAPYGGTGLAPPVAIREFRVTGTARKARRPLRAVFTAKIVEGESGFYVAYCDELPGCVTQGRTIQEAQDNFGEALALYLETLAEIAAKGRKRSVPAGKAPVKVSRFALIPV